ncbi:MAG: GspE/PulE family protein, partial [bacterium]
MDQEDLVYSLVDDDILTMEEADQSITQAQATGEDILSYLENEGFIEREQALEKYALNYGFDFIDLDNYDPSAEVLDMIDSTTAQQYFIYPIEQTGTGLKLAVSDPPDLRMVDDLEAILEMSLEFSMVDPEQLEEYVTSHYGTSIEDIDDVMSELDDDEMMYVDESEEEDTADLEAKAEEAPVIKLVNRIIMDAVQKGTSDIHIEPLEEEIRVRYRIDGICHNANEIPKRLQGAVISRIKIMSEMDISERRVPQDGRIKLKIMGKELDFRVNTLPGIHGESVVLRILDKEAISFGLGELGFLPDNKAIFDQLIRRPNGIILVTGPTGSGKTTTLYSALSEINTPDRKLVTIENPVEYQLEGINQMQVNEEIGLDFARGLKAILRQSPDVILVGEIRDYETAEIAIRSALTGHLVFSTLHTNDAPSAVNRLIDLGVNPYLISSSVQSIMAQRLVRSICDNCKHEYNPDETYLKQVGFPLEEADETTFYQGEGCSECDDTGYTGRAAIFEMLVTSEKLKEMILDEEPTQALRQQAMKDGM